MKKYIVPALALLLTAGIVNAQTTPAQSKKTAHTTSAKSAAKVTTPTDAQKQVASTTPVKRKHHKKSSAKNTTGK